MGVTFFLVGVGGCNIYWLGVGGVIFSGWVWVGVRFIWVGVGG